MKVTRLSVRAVTARGASRELECTMLVGGRSAGSSAPSHLRAEQVSAFSVKLAWHPSSSNFKHLVLLNGRMFLTCPPAQYKCLLTGEFESYKSLFFHALLRLDPVHRTLLCSYVEQDSSRTRCTMWWCARSVARD